jgi:hypothetical protein
LIGSDSILFAPPVDYNTGGYDPAGVAVADVNGDGIPDMIVANIRRNLTDQIYGASNVGAMLGNGDGTFQPVVTYLSGGSDLLSVTVADVNNDGKLDILVGNGCTIISEGICSAEGGAGVLLGNGDGTFRPAVNYGSGGFALYQMKVVVADVNGDGKADLVTLNGCASSCDPIGPPQGSVGVLLGNGDGTFQKSVAYATGGYFANSLAVSDLNRDRRLDVVVTNNCGDSNIGGCTIPGPVGVLLGNGDGTFQSAVPYASGGQGPSSVAVADVNSDGEPDLVVAGGVVGVLLGRGDGTFSAAATYGSGSYYRLAIADVDGDGRPDLVLANWNCSSSYVGCISVMPGNGDGTFQNAVNFSMGIEADSLAVADLNGDNKPDVVTANAEAFSSNDPPGVVGVLLNATGQGQAPTSTTLTSSLNPSVYGQSVTFTATVASNSGTPTGTVIFYNGSTAVGSGTLASGKTSISVSSLPAGSASITAAYQGSGSFAPSTSSPLTQTVSMATTATALTSSSNPAGTGQSITYTATVTSQYGGAATGTVTFTSGSQTLGTASLSANIAKLTSSFSSPGTYVITAKYNGDANNKGSTSSNLSQVIIASTTTSLTSSLNPAVVGQAITFTATVSSASGTPPNGEIVTFYNGSATLGTVALSGGTASLTTSSLTAGIYTITASYSGDSTFAASTSAGLRQVVNSTTKSATSTALTSSLNPSVYGQRVTFTATVTTAGSVPPTGTVVFTWGDAYRTFNIGTATLNSSGVATLTKSNLNADAYPLTAVYKGDANNLGSTSPVMNQVVLQTTSTASITSSQNPSKAGQSVTFTAKITSPTVAPTGPVTFTAGKSVLGTVQLSGGKAALTTSALPVGSTAVSVTYNGNSNIAKSSASVTQVVQP